MPEHPRGAAHGEPGAPTVGPARTVRKPSGDVSGTKAQPDRSRATRPAGPAGTTTARGGPFTTGPPPAAPFADGGTAHRSVPWSRRSTRIGV